MMGDGGEVDEKLFAVFTAHSLFTKNGAKWEKRHYEDGCPTYVFGRMIM